MFKNENRKKNYEYNTLRSNAIKHSPHIIFCPKKLFLRLL